MGSIGTEKHSPRNHIEHDWMHGGEQKSPHDFTHDLCSVAGLPFTERPWSFALIEEATSVFPMV